MTDYKLEIEEARTLFWEKMSELVIEYELYNFDPNIKEMERDLMEVYEKFDQALTHLIETEKIAEIQKVINQMDTNKTDYADTYHYLIDRLKELQGEV